LKVENERIVGLKRGIMLLLAVLLLTGCSADRGDGTVETSEEMYQETYQEADGLINAVSAVVGINSGSYRGCGVIYEKNEEYMVILTVAHVLGNASEVTIIFSDGQECISDRIVRDDETDCGFIAVSISDAEADIHTDTGINVETAVTKNRDIFDNIQNGQGVFLADGNTENELGCRYAILEDSWIYVEDFGEYMMILSGEADAGMSGCAVLDENGVFLGILCGGNEDGELAVLPYSIVEARYEELSKTL
jgi:hypothetical protein